MQKDREEAIKIKFDALSLTSDLKNSLTNLQIQVLGNQTGKIIPELELEIKNLIKLLPANPSFKNFGNKYSRLIEMAQLAKAIDLFNVPLQCGVSSNTVEQFLLSQSLAFQEQWNLLNTLYQEKNAIPFMDREGVKNLLSLIKAKISKAFDLAKENEYLFRQLVANEFATWLHDAKGFLMVRSSGNEDSALPNAGGNSSFSYIPSNRADFCEAAKNVVLSYFSEASLRNRINAKTNPFSEKPLLSFMAQELIGEDSSLPISLVLFTNEPLYVGREKFRTMRISASYGHGEGVVKAAGVAADTCLLMVSESDPHRLHTLYHTVDKQERLAPQATENGVRLTLTENPSDLKRTPALSNELLSRLYTIGILVEHYYQHPADIEIVIKEGVIHLVQTRPIDRPELLPTYLDIKRIEGLQAIQGDVLAAGKGTVVLADPKQICFADTLQEAEITYNKDLHLAVIVSQPEPANSHPVVNFSCLGVPCLRIDDFKPLQVQIKPLVICMQEGTVQVWDSSKGNVRNYIAQGFSAHPAPMKLSLPMEIGYAVKSKPAIPQDVKELLYTIRTAKTQTAALNALAKLRTHPLAASLEERCRALKGSLLEVQQTRQVVALLNQRVKTAFANAEAALCREPGTLRSLLSLKELEAWLIKNESSIDGVGQYSCLSISKYVENAHELIDYQEKFPFSVYFADIYLAGDAAFDSSSRTKWRTFLEQIEQELASKKIEKEDCDYLKEMVGVLEKADLLSFWFAFFFKGGTLKEVIGTLPSSDVDRIRALENLEQAVKKEKAYLPLFALPVSLKEGEARLQVFSEMLTGKIGEETIEEFMQHSSDLTKLVYLNKLQKGIDFYDKAVKEMKASPNWTQDEKVPIFKRMLLPYIDILKSMIEQLKPKALTNYCLRPYIDHFAKLKEAFDKHSNLGTEELYPSKEFSVAKSTLATGEVYSWYHPHTLEDYFTLLHQDLLMVLSISKNTIIDPFLKDAAIPQKLTNIMELITNIMPSFNQRLHMEITNDCFEVTYNFPLLHHSFQVTFTIKNKNDATFKLTLFDLFNDKMTREYELYIEILNEFKFIKLTNPVFLSPIEINCIWKIEEPVEENVKFPLSIFKKIRDRSNSPPVIRDDTYPFINELQIDQEKLKVFALQKINSGVPRNRRNGADLLKNLVNKGYKLGSDAYDAFSRLVDQAKREDDADLLLDIILFYPLFLKSGYPVSGDIKTFLLQKADIYAAHQDWRINEPFKLFLKTYRETLPESNLLNLNYLYKIISDIIRRK